MTEPAAQNYEPDVVYRVELSAPTRVGAVRFPARGELTMRGDLLNRLIEENGADVVLAAQPE